MDMNDIVMVSDEFETTNGSLFGKIGRVTSIDATADYPIKVHFLSINDLEVFHESELTILNKGDKNAINK